MLAKAGIREYGEKVVSALIAEFLQLDERETFMALDPMKLPKGNREKILRYCQ